jgi:hypothetical protein
MDDDDTARSWADDRSGEAQSNDDSGVFKKELDDATDIDSEEMLAACF